ncbi:NAD(P)H-dependent oxidoreductase [Gilvimarinus sp. SDUM040013]|uniref:NAD(P)H-dependent oxidoreductase n=1 Tax=Gilvimarinus gilvus TaxID=3058038 RepID=A0ABU4S1S7_9GAMM|nr:NAD(P)H-dependent oxidoreductase [Gilvimarinus sp. SDUM040013]MDO3385851.1 NAD(P)H-dependent oxidoreductase [Gilvimarinus sp. SDUM040013]MDX6851144.1 NAD(P)H-dependent oxidoreductase [Gilvimarinus sp. SDUM040013]
MKNVLTLYSSARPRGNTFAMVKVLTDLIPLQALYLDDLDIRDYDYDFGNQGDDFANVIDSMLKADVIVFACPEYWYALTPAFKRLFDRFTDLTELECLKVKGKALRKKQFYLFTTSASKKPSDAFVSVVSHTLNYLGWVFAGLVHVYCENKLDEGEAKLVLSDFVEQVSRG